jgi:hypothetical protein
MNALDPITPAARTLVALRAIGAALGPRARAATERARPALIKPSLAIEALLAGLRVLFSLEEAQVAELLAPALAPWRNAVGCTDPVLVAENAAREPQLLPLPLPSWCAHALDAGLLQLDGSPRLEQGLVVQGAHLLGLRGAALEPERFAVNFAATRADASPHVHLAISPPFSAAWRGEIWLRAAASLRDRRAPIWLGEPSHPSTRSARGATGLTVSTWAMAGPAPRWAVLRLLEDDEPQALWDLRPLRLARLGDERTPDGVSATPVSLRIALDPGNVSTAIVEEEEASAGAPGGKLLGGRAPGSGLVRLAGDEQSAHRYGCAERLNSSGSRVPTVLCAAGPEVLAALLRGECGPEQLWLSQAGEGPGPALRLERFKSSDDPGLADPRLLEAFGALLGRTLAAAHASPLTLAGTADSPGRAPRLERADCVLLFARSPTDRDRARVDAFGAALCEGLRAAWSASSHRLLSRFAAAAPSRDRAHFPVEIDARLGGRQLQIAVHLPLREGRPALAVPTSTARFQLGGERLLEAVSLACAEPGGASSRAKFQARLLEMLRLAGGDSPALLEANMARAVRETLLRWTTRLLERQLAGTLRRSSPDGATMQGAGVRVRLFGEGWKLLALDVPDDRREGEVERILERAFAAPALFAHAPRRAEWLPAQRLCAWAIHLEQEQEEPGGAELTGIDTLAGPRWFSRVEDDARAPVPSPTDPWWRDFTEEIPGPLLRSDQWFARGPPFESGLAGGLLAFAPGRSVLRQWLDLCGPSLFALQLRKRR